MVRDDYLSNSPVIRITDSKWGGVGIERQKDGGSNLLDILKSF